jgi:hypothetical protein
MIQYRTSGSTVWSSSVGPVTATDVVLPDLQPATTYEFRVLAENPDGLGPASATATATTEPLAGAVSSIEWNMTPTGPYTHGSGAIGVNAFVTPTDAAIRFGFSTSASVPPVVWTLGIHVMTNLWGAYVDTPSTVGTWYAWAQGTDGSATTLHPAPFMVQ